LDRSRPERSEKLLSLGQEDIDRRWKLYEGLAAVERGTSKDKEKA